MTRQVSTRGPILLLCILPLVFSLLVPPAAASAQGQPPRPAPRAPAAPLASAPAPQAICPTSTSGASIFLPLVASGRAGLTPSAVEASAAALAGERWSSPATWGGSVPAAGANVTIPAGKTVLLDVSPPPLGTIMIEGTLAFAEQDLSLQARAIMIHGGALRVGSPERPFPARATITLGGSAPQDDLMGMGGNVLGAMMGGTVSLHGAAVRGWTKLAATAERGARTITVLDATGWKAGDRIALASTGYYPVDQPEEFTIQAINGNQITLDAPIVFTKWGELQTIAGCTVDQRAEVALLTRNVTVQGDAASATSGFGGHIMAMDTAKIQLSGVELRRMGQRARSGRYPVHWHLTGDSSGSFLRNTSIWQSHNRCVTLHGADNVELTRNVCYHIPGHAFFLEDGAETDNRFTENLAFRITQPAAEHRLLDSDRRPSAYWITNPDNSFVGNVAANSASVGFWFALPERPLGLSAAQPDRPVNTPLGRFDDNVAHSNGDEGLFIDDAPREDGTLIPNTEYVPRADPSDPNSAIVPPVIRNLLVYKHDSRSIWYRTTQLRLVNPIFADNFTAVDGANSSWFTEAPEKKANIVGGLVVGISANEPIYYTRFQRRLSMLRGIELYDGRVVVQGTTFVNFQPGTNAAFTSHAASPSDTQPYQAAALSLRQNDQWAMLDRILLDRVQLVDAVPTVYDPPGSDPDHGDFTQVHQDVDGSWLGEGPGKYIVGPYDYVLTERCQARPVMNAHLCDEPYVQQSFSFNGAQATGHTVTRDDGVSYTTDDSKVVLIAGRSYRWTFNNGQVPRDMRIDFMSMPEGQSIMMNIPFPAAPSSASINFTGRVQMTAAQSLAEVQAGSGTLYYYDAAEQRLHFKVVYRRAPSHPDQVIYFFKTP